MVTLIAMWMWMGQMHFFSKQILEGISITNPVLLAKKNLGVQLLGRYEF
jgi:hypothetical protein